MPTKKNTQKATQAQPAANSPDFIAYQVIDRSEGRKPIWRSIGSAWRHNDGKGIQVRLDSFPIGGVVTLRPPLPDSES